MPDNLDSVRVTERKGMFLSQVCKGYIFMYQIHSDGDDMNQSKECEQPNVCWSLFVRIGRVTHTIWRFHKFTE